MKLRTIATIAVAVSVAACAAETSRAPAETASNEIVAGGPACEHAAPDTDLACIAIFDPVCGCDGTTYGNACEASRFVASSTPGACEGEGEACALAEPDLDRMCITLYDPVCGCDGKTYGNGCEASRFVASSTPGACEGEGEGEACELAEPDLDRMCITLYDPVCGCDGKTYGNGCEASRFVASSTPGACASAQ